MAQPEVGDDEKSLEKILLDIESLQCRVLDLTSQFKTIVFNNAGGIICTSGMSVPGEYSHDSPSLSPRCSLVNTSKFPYVSAFENEEKVLPGSAVSSYNDGGHLVIIESTVDLLSSAISRGQHRNLANEGLDDILINNQVVNEEFHRFEKGNHVGEMPGVTVKEEEEENFDRKVSSSETETDIEIAPIVQKARQRSDLDVNLRRNNRKRKIKRTSRGSWAGEQKRKRKK